MQKAQREVEAFHRFQQLSKQLLEINEKICRARPIEAPQSPQKKTPEAIQHEAAREIADLLDVIFTGSHKGGKFDLEGIGANLLEQLLSAPHEFERTLPRSCGKQARLHQMRPKQLLTELGPISNERPYYLCPVCHQGQNKATYIWPHACSIRQLLKTIAE
jgi:hypothetical protein